MEMQVKNRAWVKNAVIVFLIGHKIILTIQKVFKKTLARLNIDMTAGQFFSSVLNAILHIFLVFIIAAQLGFSTSTIIAVLGSATLAIGLALQDSLAFIEETLKGLGLANELIFRTLLLINPVTAPVEVFRYALLGQGTIVPWALVWSWAFTLIVAVFGVMIFNRVEKTFMDTV